LHAVHGSQPLLVLPRRAPGTPPGPPAPHLAVLGPGTAAAVVSRPLGDGRHELVLTHDRDLVAAVVADLLEREDPALPGPAVPVARREPPAAPPAAAAPAGPELSTPDPVAAVARYGLDAVLQQAVDTDRRRGSGCALLLLGTDATGAADTSAADPSALVARRLRSSVRSADRWIPLGERLHAVLLTGLPLTVAEGVVDRVADALLHALESSALTAPEASGIRVSIGASLAPTRAATAADAVTQAAAALEAARSAGGHCARIWPV
ncbi:diguanylate cyclase, partial [Kineococcus sp. R8]|uniref:diguanylate cyclase domain-containing protein n=1 Tax=Kineococcus siccus TaxID=2696567 RepID=UPI0014133D0C